MVAFKNYTNADESAKQSSRRSSRRKKQVDYNEEDHLDYEEGLAPPPAAVNWYDAVLQEGHADASSCCWITQAGQVTAEQLLSTGFQCPVLMQPLDTPAATAAALGMCLPHGFSLHSLLQGLGPKHSVPVMDVSTQEMWPHMSMAEWVDYFNAPDRSSRRLFNVLSLSLAGTPLEAQVSAPSMVYQLDLASQVWPGAAAGAAAAAAIAASSSSSNSTAAAAGEGMRRRGPTPRSALLYCLSSPAGCYTDWHVDFGGSAVWYHVIQGSKVFLVAPPLPTNLAAFESWARSKKQGRTWLGKMLQGVTRVELEAGDTLLLPPGWPHVVATPTDSFVIGGNFLTSCHLPTHLAIASMEGRLKVTPSCQYPGFRSLMWAAAGSFSRRLQQQQQHGATAAADGGRLYGCELDGLPALMEALRQWLYAGGAADVPPDVHDPEGGYLTVQVCRSLVLHKPSKPTPLWEVTERAC